MKKRATKLFGLFLSVVLMGSFAPMAFAQTVPHIPAQAAAPTGSEITQPAVSDGSDTVMRANPLPSENLSSTPAPAASAADLSEKADIEAFVDAAEAQLGKKYVRGGKGPSVFDCSGLVYYALKSSGNGIPYMTSRLWAVSSYTRVNSMDELQRGDVVCFRGHVGIYLGNGAMIDASYSQGKVRITYNIQESSYWQRNFICGRRPL